MQIIIKLLPMLALLFSFTACEKEEFVNPESEVQSLKVDLGANAHKLKESYRADLGSLNNSGVTGTATLTVDGDQLTVSIEASGMVPGKLHPQHIHGHTGSPRAGVCPPPSADTNDDGMISVPEGAPFYGAVLLPLTPFPVADEKGNISYTKTFQYTSDLGQLQKRVIVLHGGDFGGEYLVTLPVACGKIKVSK